MKNDLLTELRAFKAETGLSDHRIGMLVANNGRLIERLESGRRIWPETHDAAVKGLEAARADRARKAQKAAVS